MGVIYFVDQFVQSANFLLTSLFWVLRIQYDCFNIQVIVTAELRPSVLARPGQGGAVMSWLQGELGERAQCKEQQLIMLTSHAPSHILYRWINMSYSRDLTHILHNVMTQC